MGRGGARDRGAWIRQSRASFSVSHMVQSLSVFRRIDAGDKVIGDAPDQALIQRFKAGDEQAFNELVRRYQGRVHSLACRMVRDPESASDICQDVFVKAYQSLRKFREDSAVYTWLYRITSNLCANYLRRKKLRDAISYENIADWMAGRDAGPDRELARGGVGAAVAEAVDRLPPRQRVVFLLRQYEGLSHEEIAVTLKRSVGAVKANYFHAVQRLQKELAGYQRFIEDGRL
ncbi:MAG: sigma-70 family RNA polymerase sigma factor [Candidatus Latescibacteria bacterium]|nr:sigma-70 family RNA polymerase sigma factor [Candidatus Latescibacterota bacterium]